MRKLLNRGGGNREGLAKVGGHGQKSKRRVPRIYQAKISRGRVQKKNGGKKVSNKGSGCGKGKKQMGFNARKKIHSCSRQRSFQRGSLRALGGTKGVLGRCGISTGESGICQDSAGVSTTSLLSSIDKGFGALTVLIKAFDSLSTMN